MKHSLCLLIGVLLLQSASAKVWRVNNNPGVTANFTTVQQAHDNASVLPGDTLHIEPSITNYGDLTMTKRLTIISIGNFLDANPGNQASLVTGNISALYISTSTAGNSVFHANFTSVSATSANGLRFERCKIESSLQLFSSNNHVVTGCYISWIDMATSTNNVISNNILEWYVNTAGDCSAVITHNIIASRYNTSSSISNSTFQNNIINKDGTITFTNCQITNNVSSNTTLPAGNGNLNSVNMATVFIDPDGLKDTSFVLQSAAPNPAKGAGTAGVDCGAFGGPGPFKRGLQPAIPAIYKMQAPATPAGASMNVTFSTKSNN